MNKEEIIRKITSRKFIVSVITMIVGIITIFVGKNEGVVAVSGAATVIIPAVVYCIMEGRVDAASVKQITDATAEAAEKLGADKDTTEQIKQIGEAVENIVSDDESSEK